jgi:hypothetical protein
LVDDGDLSPAIGYEEAQRLALHAIEISPEAAELHALLAYLHEQTFPRKRAFTTILDIRCKILIYITKVGRMAIELSS